MADLFRLATRTGIQYWYPTDKPPYYYVDYYIWIDDEDLPSVDRGCDLVFHIDDWLTLYISGDKPI